MASFLPEAIESVIDAAPPGLDIELIVADDGSADHTRKVIRQSQEQYRSGAHLAEFTYLETTHGGKSQALNTALEKARGNYITILDADDKLPRGSLLYRYRSATEQNADLVIGSFSTFNQSGVLHTREISPRSTAQALIDKLLFSIRSPFHQNSMLVSHHLMKQAGPFDERLLRGQDKDFALRVLEKAQHLVVLEEPVYLYRRYPRGFYNRMKNRLRTLRYKSIVLSRHTSGTRKIAALAWGNLVELAKLWYELFSFYRK